MKSIGGALDYRVLADFHRPTDYAAIAEEVERLSRSGLTSRDIGAALHMDWVAVESILRADQEQAA